MSKSVQKEHVVVDLVFLSENVRFHLKIIPYEIEYFVICLTFLHFVVFPGKSYFVCLFYEEKKIRILI